MDHRNWEKLEAHAHKNPDFINNTINRLSLWKVSLTEFTNHYSSQQWFKVSDSKGQTVWVWVPPSDGHRVTIQCSLDPKVQSRYAKNLLGVREAINILVGTEYTKLWQLINHQHQDECHTVGWQS